MLVVCIALIASRSASAQEEARGVSVRMSLGADEPDETRVWVDDVELPHDAWTRPVVVPAGAVSVRAEGPGRAPVRVTLRAVDGATVVVPIRWPEPRVAPTPPPRPPVSGWAVAGWFGVAVGVGAVALSGYFLSVNLHERANASSSPVWAFFNARVNPSDAAGNRALDGDEVCDRARAEPPSSERAVLVGLCDRSARARALAWAFGAGGVALVALGVTSVILAPRRSAPRAQVSPIASPGAFGAALTVRF